MLKNDILQCDYIFGEKGEVEVKENLFIEIGSINKIFTATFLSKAIHERLLEGLQPIGMTS